MKPIASRKLGWCAVPYAIEIHPSLEGVIIIYFGNKEEPLSVSLPKGLTFAQFMQQYNDCTDAIYFID